MHDFLIVESIIRRSLAIAQIPTEIGRLTAFWAFAKYYELAKTTELLETKLLPRVAFKSMMIPAAELGLPLPPGPPQR